MAVQLIGWSVGWLNGCVVDWLVCWLVNGCVVDWLVCWLVEWLCSGLVSLLVGWMAV